MRNILFFFILTISFSIFTSCSSSNSPDQTAINFMKSFSDGDFEKAKEYATVDTRSMISMLESFGVKDQMEEMGLGTKSKFSVKNSEVSDNKATVTLEITDADSEKEEMPIALVKKDGEWLVDMDKEDLGKENGMGDLENLDKEEGNPLLDLESEN